MLGTCSAKWGWAAVAFGALLLAPGILVAADRPGGVSCLGKYNPDDQTVRLFAGIESGKLDVQLIPRNSKRSRVLIKNKTDKPLNVQFPAAFAAVPVLAQFEDLGRDRAAQRDKQPQAIGGPFNMPQNRGRDNLPLFKLGEPNNRRNLDWLNGPLLNVSPEHVGQMKLVTVCLDHGKAEPRPKIKYQIKPIEKVTDKPAVQELCRIMGRVAISQRTAQLAAWHLNNQMSWKDLADMKTKTAVGTKPSFTGRELEAGKRLAEKAIQLAKKRRAAQSSGKLSRR